MGKYLFLCLLALVTIHPFMEWLGGRSPFIKMTMANNVRSGNLTDAAGQWLAAVADEAGMSGNDYLEALAEGDTPLVETVKADLETDGANPTHQSDSEISPSMEAVRAENQCLHTQLGNSASEKESLEQELVEVRSQLETERADVNKLRQNSQS